MSEVSKDRLSVVDVATHLPAGEDVSEIHRENLRGNSEGPYICSNLYFFLSSNGMQMTVGLDGMHQTDLKDTHSLGNRNSSRQLHIKQDHL